MAHADALVAVVEQRGDQLTLSLEGHLVESLADRGIALGRSEDGGDQRVDDSSPAIGGTSRSTWGRTPKKSCGATQETSPPPSVAGAGKEGSVVQSIVRISPVNSDRGYAAT